MMDDNTLKSLRKIDAPAPDTERKAKNIAIAKQSLEESLQKNAQNAQGNAKGERLTHSSTTLWSRLMKHQWIAGTALAGVLAVALIVPQGQELLSGGASLSDDATVNTAPLPEAQEQLAELDAIAPQRQTPKKEAITAAPQAPLMKMRAATDGVVVSNRVQQSFAAGAVAPAMDMIAPVQPTYEGRDRFEEIEANDVKQVSEEPVSTFSIDVDTAAYSFIRKSLNNGVLPQKNAVRIEEMINYFDYDYPLPENADQPFKPTVAVYPSPWRAQAKIVHIGIKGLDIVPNEKPRSNLVFLLDVSGSMNQQDKLPLLKNAFRMLVDTLDGEDTVAIVTYAGNAGTVLEPTKVSEKGKILAALDALQPGGATAGAQGIEQAYALAEQNFDKDGINRVFLATDGDFNVGITNSEELKGYVERKRESGVFLSVLGFGRGNYNDQLMQALAQNGNGNAAYIDTLSEARKVLVDEASSTLFPIAKDVKIQVEFNPNRVSEYRLIGYETRMLNREDFNNDKVDAGDIGAGYSVTALYEIVPTDATTKQVDPLRYQTEEAAAAPKVNASAEYRFSQLAWNWRQ